MKIAIFCDYFHSFGGTEYYNSMLATELKKRGADVRVYICEKTKNPYWVDILKESNIGYREPKRHRIDRNDRSVDIEFIDENIDDLNKWGPDVIHASPAGNLLIAYLNNNKRKNTPIVATEHTTPCAGSEFWYPNGFQKCIQNTDAYIATCKASARGIRQFHNFKKTIKVIPHLIKPQKTQKTDRIPNSAACIARMSPEKGIGILLPAWKEVVKKIPDATLYLYGEGHGKSHFEELLLTLGLKDSVFFCGNFPPHIGIGSIANKHDIFVQPSLFESIPTTLIELSIIGRPMIATDVGGIKEIINKDTGVLIKSGSTDKLAKAIINLLQNKEKQRLLSENAKAFAADKYSLNTNVMRIIQLYNSVIKKHK